MLFVVEEKWDGKLLRDFLRNGCSVSRKALVHLKSLDGGIRLNGEVVTVRALVHTADCVELMLEDSASDENPNVVPHGKIPQIIYEDDALIAVNKPAGMPTHTSFGHYLDALSNTVCAYLNKKGQPFVFRAVNRLDTDTSGIVLIAKNRYYSSILSESLKNGDFKKSYIAIVNGKAEACGRIEGYIAREKESIIKRKLLFEKENGSEYSLTEYERIAFSEKASLLRVIPHTGRTHQIRLHLSSTGHSIIGDTMYGEGSEDIKRQALHASSLAFPSPTDGKIIELNAELPCDMLALIKKYSLDFSESK